jgi:hypothetical protein
MSKIELKKNRIKNICKLELKIKFVKENSKKLKLKLKKKFSKLELKSKRVKNPK